VYATGSVVKGGDVSLEGNNADSMGGGLLLELSDTELSNLNIVSSWPGAPPAGCARLAPASPPSSPLPLKPLPAPKPPTSPAPSLQVSTNAKEEGGGLHVTGGSFKLDKGKVAQCSAGDGGGMFAQVGRRCRRQQLWPGRDAARPAAPAAPARFGAGAGAVGCGLRRLLP
jgi:hypothetical protein